MIKSTQEQATAAWINELNQTRLNTLTDNLDWQDDNLENAFEEIIRVTQMAKETPSALNKTELSLVKKVEQFEISTGLDIHRDVRPAIVRYDEVQQGTVKKTINSIC